MPAGNDRPLRIAYLTEWSPYESSGVLKKLVGQVRAWRELGCEARLFALAPSRPGPAAGGFADVGEVHGAIGQAALDRRPGLRLGYFNKIATVPRLLRALRVYRPDILYYRQQGPWYPGIGRLLGVAPAVVEINTIEGAEAGRWGALHALAHRLTGGRVLARADALVCVTEEIARHYASPGKPWAVIANSLDQAPRALPPTDNAAPAFVFVGSATVGRDSWHGVDKIVSLARQLPDCAFHVAGMQAADIGETAPPPNLRFHGPLHGEALEQLYRRSDVAISTLALHRMDMEEACPLKTREYLLNGLPVILGYREAEAALRGADYVLDIGNREENVADSAGSIRDFAHRWRGRRVAADLGFLTSEAKARDRLNFFRALLARTSQASASS